MDGRALAAGSFFGRRVARREANGLEVREYRYAPGIVIPMHGHERAYFSFVVAGGKERARRHRCPPRDPAALLERRRSPTTTSLSRSTWQTLSLPT